MSAMEGQSRKESFKELQVKFWPTYMVKNHAESTLMKLYYYANVCMTHIPMVCGFSTFIFLPSFLLLLRVDALVMRQLKLIDLK